MQIQYTAIFFTYFSTLLLETLLDDVRVELVSIRVEETRLHERRRVVNFMFLRLREENVSACDTRGCTVWVRTYSLFELGNGHSDQFWLPMALQLEEACLVLDDLSQEERKQFLMITRLGEILAEALSCTRSQMMWIS